MSSVEVPRPLPAGARLHGLLALARVSNVPTVASGAVAGAALATAGSPEPGRTGAAALALMAIYLGGMVLNDLLDLEIDRRERPERPLPAGLVSRSEAALAIAALFTAGLVALALLGLRPFAAGAVLVGLVVIYDAWHKGNALSPLLMGGCRALVYVTAFLAFDAGLSSDVALAAALLALYTVAVTALAKREQDGPLASWWPAGILLGAPAVWLAQAASGWGVAAGVAALAVVAVAVARARRGDVRGAVGLSIAAMALYDATVIGAIEGAGTAVAFAGAAFVLTVAAQRWIPGT